MNDLNIRPDGKVVPLPEFVPVGCVVCSGNGRMYIRESLHTLTTVAAECPDCCGLGSVLINKDRLKVVNT